MPTHSTSLEREQGNAQVKGHFLFERAKTRNIPQAIPTTNQHPQLHSVSPPMPTYPLIVAQYSILGHPRRTEHWNLVALKSRREGRIFELVGNYDTFAYVPRDTHSFNKVIDYCGGCHVGWIDATPERLMWLEEKLKEVLVIRHDPSFDSQTWVVDVLRLLRGEGVVFPSANEEAVRDELAKDVLLWDLGEETVEERLFPQS